MSLQSNFKIIVFILGLTLQSCATQNLFLPNNDASNSPDYRVLLGKQVHNIQPDDKISVSIWNHNDLSVGSVFGIYNSNEVYGKWVLVNQKGEVNLPRIACIQLAGLTTEEAAQILREQYSFYIVDPIVVVKVLNRELTVLGEVFTPGTYLLEKEENTLFEMIGKAGGLGFYADKKHVKLIRDDIEYELDLTEMEDFVQNNITLIANDILYIPTNKGKSIDKKAPTIISFVSIATTIVVILSLFSTR
ncbi:MAG: polysaccharide export protein [Flavobacteriales bacterium]|nr:polysaccharide export protein [Flavobacteriales bacterium]